MFGNKKYQLSSDCLINLLGRFQKMAKLSSYVTFYRQTRWSTYATSATNDSAISSTSQSAEYDDSSFNKCCVSTRPLNYRNQKFTVIRIRYCICKTRTRSSDRSTTNYKPVPKSSRFRTRKSSPGLWVDWNWACFCIYSIGGSCWCVVCLGK